MSYRNPQIIVDRSAEIYAQASAQFGQQLAQGVQNYFDNKEKQAAAVKKKKEAYQLALNDVTLNYNKELNAATEEIDESSLFGDVQDQARLKLDGDENNIGIIEMATQLKMNPDLDRETRSKYLKSVSDYEVWQKGIIDKIGATIVDIEPLEDMNAGNIGEGWDFAGTGNEKFQNMVVSNTLANKSFSGIQTSKKLNGNMLNVNMVIDPNDEKIKKYVADGILDLNELKAGEDGKYYLDWTRNIDKWEGGLIAKVPSAFDGVTALETAGIIDNKGLPKEGFFTETKSIVENIKGTNKQKIYQRQYFNPDLIATNPTFETEATKYAKKLSQLSTGETLSALENHFGYEISSKKWLDMTGSEQTKKIKELITDKEIARITGGFKTEVIKDGVVLKNPTIEQTRSADEVRYYQQDKGVLVQEPSEDAGTLSDYKTARQRIEENVSAIDKEFSELSMLQVNEFLKGKIEDLGFVVEDLETEAGELSKLVVGTGANRKIIRPEDTPLEVKRKLLMAAGATLKEANDMLKGQKNPSSGMGFPETKDTIREPLPIS
jgi:hypothetical protein